MNLSRSWIWLDRSVYPDLQKTRVSVFDHSCQPSPAMAVFRRVFFLESVPEDLTAYFSGDCKFRLFINGRFLDDGPVEVGGDYANSTPPDWWFFDSRNVAEFFQAGENVIVAEVLTVPEAQTDYSVGHPGFTFELESGGVSLLRSDSSWSSFRNPAYGTGMPIDSTRIIILLISMLPDGFLRRSFPRNSVQNGTCGNGICRRLRSARFCRERAGSCSRN